MIRRRRFIAGGEDAAGRPPGAIDLVYTQRQFGPLVMVTATPTPADDTLYYQWYVNGQPVGGLTRDNQFAAATAADDALEIRALALHTPELNAWAHAPPARDGRVVLEWTDALDANATYYVVEYAFADIGTPGEYFPAATVPRDGRWSYRWYSPRMGLDSGLLVRVTSYSANGDAGAALEIGPLYARKRPDWPLLTASYDAGSGNVTIDVTE